MFVCVQTCFFFKCWLACEFKHLFKRAGAPSLPLGCGNIYVIEVSGCLATARPSMQQPTIAHATLTLKGEECYRARPQIYSYRMVMVGCLYKKSYTVKHIQQATNTTNTTILWALQRSSYESLTMHTISESAYRASIVCDENLPWTHTHNVHNIHIHIRLSVYVADSTYMYV